MDLPVLLLHKYPEYAMQCCTLINSEWKRSITARMRSLDCSCDTLPTNLILLKDDKVIGHCKLSNIPSIRDACFVESVVIDQTLRGKGYGKYLMMKTEDHCKHVLDLKRIYLSTHDKEMFYSKLGYHRCQPVSIYGGYSPNNFSATRTINNVSEKGSKNIGPVPPPMPKVTNSFNQNAKVYMYKDL